jgi:hypothetical protein
MVFRPHHLGAVMSKAPCHAKQSVHLMLESGNEGARVPCPHDWKTSTGLYILKVPLPPYIAAQA